MQSYEYLGKPLQIGSLTIKNSRLWRRSLQAAALLSMRLAMVSRSARFSTPYGTAMRSATTFNQSIRQNALYKIIMQFLRRKSP